MVSPNSRTPARMRPRVSIVMPAFNRADLIVESVRSVIAQTFAEWELIIVDDGSTDDSVARVEALAEPRIMVIRQPRTGNVARLRNLGIAAARGDYVAFLDSDDLWLPAKLEIQLASLSGQPQAWCYAAHALVDAAGAPMPLRAGRFQPASGRIVRQLLAGETGATIITWLVPRALLDQVGGFDESLDLQEDLDLVLRLAEAADAVAVPQVLALAREHQGRKTSAAGDVHGQTARVFEKAAARLGDPALRRLAKMRQAEHRMRSEPSAAGRLLHRVRLAGAAIDCLIGTAAARLWRMAKR
jgi:glycosyltransferase involved in cell wall biosynthesis